jgi:hypothetical protein
MHLNRGNHETVNMNKMYGFEVGDDPRRYPPNVLRCCLALLFLSGCAEHHSSACRGLVRIGYVETASSGGQGRLESAGRGYALAMNGA